MRRAVLVGVALALFAGGCFVVMPSGVVVGVARPTLAYIPGTSIQVVTNAPGDVFYQGGSYWRYHNGFWWRSSIWTGGWLRASVVPRAFLSIPATHPRYRVVRHHPAYRPPVVKHVPRPVRHAPPVVRKAKPRPAVGKAKPRPVRPARPPHTGKPTKKEKEKEKKEKKERAKKPARPRHR